jgi:hypothetical protein
MRWIVLPLFLLVLAARPSLGWVSTNVPLDHWSYPAVEKLANYGLIDSAMLTTLPLTRVEMARHVAQAMPALERMPDAPPILGAILERLQLEYQGELMRMGLLDGWYGETFVKPIEDPYARYLYATSTPDLENRRGDRFQEGSNVRAGFASRAAFFDRFAFYVHPEYRDSSRMTGDVEWIAAYGKVGLGPFEIQAGRDSLWWGPGRHGSILMSNNAKPFTMIQVTNPQPIQLPWIFRALGPIRGQWFLTELEKDRHVPETKLTGVRVNLKPHPLWELGFSRVIMFGGRGVPSVGLFDYAKLLLATSNQELDNQIAGFDTSMLLPLSELPLVHRLPFRSLRFYVDGAGEDEAGGLPSNWGFLYGLQINDILKTGRTDLRIEYADNHHSGKPYVFYTHSIYRSGYTYDGRVIGHHMGTQSSDLFVQLSHYLTDDVLVNLAFNRQTSDFRTRAQASANIYELDVTFFASRDWRVQGGYRYEDRRDTGDDNNHIFEIGLTRRF